MAVLAAFGDDAELRAQRRRLPPVVRPAAAAGPGAAADRGRHPQHADGAELRVEGYFAVTTNTVQFGARRRRCGSASTTSASSGHLASTR